MLIRIKAAVYLPEKFLLKDGKTCRQMKGKI